MFQFTIDFIERENNAPHDLLSHHCLLINEKNVFYLLNCFILLLPFHLVYLAYNS